MCQLSLFFPRTIRKLVAITLFVVAATASAKDELRVCADPDNLPFSNRKQEGFENKIAKELAKDMHAKLSYTWLMQRQGFIRQTLGKERCDVIIGLPQGYERVLSTQPYYRSGYVFITASRRHLKIASFDDPNLRNLKIGLHAFGNDGSNSPPAMALAKRGIVQNLVGFTLWGEASDKNAQGKIVDAVAKGDIDVAMVWGPVGGFFARNYGKELELTPIPDDAKLPDMSFSYDIAMGVRKDDKTFADRLNKSIERKRSTIQDILTAYNIPLINQNAGLNLSQSKAIEETHEKQNKR